MIKTNPICHIFHSHKIFMFIYDQSFEVRVLFPYRTWDRTYNRPIYSYMGAHMLYLLLALKLNCMVGNGCWSMCHDNQESTSLGQYYNLLYLCIIPPHRLICHLFLDISKFLHYFSHNISFISYKIIQLLFEKSENFVITTFSKY